MSGGDRMLHQVRPMLERIAYLGYLALLVSSIGCVAWGLCITFNGDGPALALGGCGGLALTWVTGPLGRKYLHFDECENSFELVERDGLFHLDTDHERRA